MKYDDLVVSSISDVSDVFEEGRWSVIMVIGLKIPLDWESLLAQLIGVSRGSILV